MRARAGMARARGECKVSGQDKANASGRDSLACFAIFNSAVILYVFGLNNGMLG